MNLKNSSERIAKSIADLANSLISEKKKVIISEIIPVIDEWNNRAEDENSHLINMCKALNTDFIDNSTFNPKKN